MATQNPYSDSLLADAFRGSLSNLESLGRGFAVAPVGLLGDVNALAREYITPRLPSSVQGLLQQMPAAPTTERILSNIPRVSAPRMETAGMEQLGAAMNPRGPVDLARGAGRLAGSAVNEAMVYGRGPLAAITPQPMRIFIGPESKLWNSNNAFRAANMASKGGDAKEIWKKTGTFQGPDGAWRQEISDADAILTNNQKNFEGKLHETFSHPTLYEHYPSLQYYDTEINSEIALPEHLKKTLIGKGKGLFSEKDFVTGEPRIEAQAFSDNDKQVLIHELQHAVQAKENFARGGTPEMFQQSGNQIYTEPVLFNAKWLRDTAEKQGISVDDLWKKQNKSVFNESTLDAAKNPYLDDMYKTAEGGKDPYSAYLKLGGEAEARAAAKRSDYSNQMRQDIFPLDDYDVPVNDLIMFGEHGEKQKKMLRGLLD